eukprot:TRINITY_DN2832_c0_g3_i1.p1 TRINITY_DN2832_c0_g3~~TRINITY_DN2832_c0_g3_i1.p1  ORF type:complete len:325 (-),score=88.81 TRINITY_DN2832_c0_g3_i1:721-1695(-)
MSSGKVVVTGANGFIASHIVRILLEKSYQVVGTVRDPTNETKVGHLRSLPNADANLSLKKADLLDDASVYQSLFEDAVGVFHTASPIGLTDGDEDSYVGPARQGVLTVMEACHNTPTLRRLVLTSSTASVCGGQPEDKVLSDTDWSDTDDQRTRKAWYSLSKTLAEKAAWSFVEEKKPSFSLVTVCPTLVIGPMLQTSANYTNLAVLAFLKGERSEVPNGSISMVHVNDVAEAHVAAFEKEDASGRYLAVSRSLLWDDIMALLAKCAPEQADKLPSRPEGQSNTNTNATKFNLAKLEGLLGRAPMTVEDAVADSVRHYKERGLF